MLCPLPNFFADIAWVRMAAFSQNWGDTAVVRGLSGTDATHESPLIRPVGYFLPKGAKGRHFTQQILITKLL